MRLKFILIILVCGSLFCGKNKVEKVENLPITINGNNYKSGFDSKPKAIHFKKGPAILTMKSGKTFLTVNLLNEDKELLSIIGFIKKDSSLQKSFMIEEEGTYLIEIIGGWTKDWQVSIE